MRRSSKSQGMRQTGREDPTPSPQSPEGQELELEKLLKQFAYQPGYFFLNDEETRRAKARLEELLKTHWGTVQGDVVEQGRALVEWILLCPQLLKGQPGFEWVQENFIKLLAQRLRYWDVGQKAARDRKGRLIGVDDQLFWKIVSNVRGKLNRGHPHSVIKDYARANRVMYVMMFENTATGQPITEAEATKIVAHWEVLQRVLDGVAFVRSVAELSKEEANRIVASWGIDQRTGAVGFLRASRNCTIEDADRLIDDWNAEQKRRRATDFLVKKLRYSETKATDIVTRLKINETVGKDAAIRFLIEKHSYKDTAAGKVVNRWGNTGGTESADPSPVSRSLRVVEAQGLWGRLGDMEVSNKEEVQKVMDLFIKRTRREEQGQTDQFTAEEEHDLKRLATRLWQR